MDFETLNLTELIVLWTDPYSVLDGQVWIKVLIVVSQSLVLICGTGLYLGLLCHERFGEDPKKRGLLNQVYNCESI